MSSQSTAVVGGLLRGFGRTLVDRDQRERDEIARLQEDAKQRAREMRNEFIRREERRQDRQDRADERAQDRADRQNDVMSIQSSDTGEAMGVTRSGEVRGLGFHLPSKNSSGGLSADDDRMMRRIEARYTTDGGLTEGSKTDWNAVVRTLESEGRPDLANMLRAEHGLSGAPDVNSAEWQQAQAQAEKWVNDQAGLFRSDKTDFSAYGGNREQAKHQKALEFYRDLTGAPGSGAAPPGGGVPQGFDALTRHHQASMSGGPVQNDDGTISTVRTIIVNLDGKETIIPTVWDGKIVSDQEAVKRARESGQQWPQFDTVAQAESADQQWHRAMGLTGGNQPPGSGTQDDPFRATTQDQVDWFKQSAPAGSVIEVDGQLFTK